LSLIIFFHDEKHGERLKLYYYRQNIFIEAVGINSK